jgi:hypothetical protein
MALLPLGAKPYLCVSTEMELTLEQRKSKPPVSAHGEAKPARER